MRFAHFAPIALLCGLSACGPSGERSTAQLLNHRLQDRLGADIAANRVALQPANDGATVTFLDTASNTPGALQPAEATTGSPRASMVEGLLDPYLMRLSVADTSSLPESRKSQRTAALTQYLQAFQLGDTLVPATAQPGGPPGLAVTIKVVCPHRNDGWGYDDGKRKPACF